MQVLNRALGMIGIRAEVDENMRPNYQRLMREALQRIDAAEHMLREASSLEQLDLARSAYQSAQAEVQQVVRAAKRERGIALRPIAETEEMHRRMREFMNGHETEQRSPRRKSGAGKVG